VDAILEGAGRSVSWIHNLAGQTDLAETAYLLRDAAVASARQRPRAYCRGHGRAHGYAHARTEQENSSQRWKPLGEYSWVLEKPLTRHWFETRNGLAGAARTYTPEEIIEPSGLRWRRRPRVGCFARCAQNTLGSVRVKSRMAQGGLGVAQFLAPKRWTRP